MKLLGIYFSSGAPLRVGRGLFVSCDLAWTSVVVPMKRANRMKEGCFIGLDCGR